MKPEHGFLIGILVIILIVVGIGLSSAYTTQWQQYNIIYYTTAFIIGAVFYIFIQRHEHKQKK